MKPLFMDFMEDCCFVERTRVPDGQGGISTVWTDGASFRAAIVLDTSSEMLSAQAAGLNNRYRVSADPAVTLEYHDVFRRLSDGQVFRVTSNSDDKTTPERATFRMAVVTAEEWVIPA